MDKIKKRLVVDPNIDFSGLPIDKAIKVLQNLKDDGCTTIELYVMGGDPYLVGIKEYLESDSEFEKRVAEYKINELRQEQAELVELARLKEKYENKP